MTSAPDAGMEALEAGELLRRLRDAGVSVWVEDGRLRYRSPPGALTPALRADVAERRAGLVRLLTAAAGAGAEAAIPRRADPSAPLKLTPAQAAIWAAERSGAAGDAFHIAAAYVLSGELDEAALESAFAALAARHEALRLVVEDGPDGARQRVLPPGSAPPPFTTGNGSDWVEGFVSAPFDFGPAPPWRAKLARIGPREWLLAVVLHHLLADGGSLRVLFAELPDAYAAKLGTREPPLGFGDVAAWTAGRAGGARRAEAVAAQRRRLEGAPQGLTVLPDFRRPGQGGAVPAGTAGAVLPAAAADALRRLAAAEGTTLFAGLLAAYALLLQRQGGGDDLVVTVPLLGHDHPSLAGVVGLLVNRVPLRLDLSGRPSFRALLGRVRTAVRAGIAHGEAPFEEVAAGLGGARLGEVLFALQTVAGAPPVLPGLEAEPLPLRTNTAKAALYLSAEEAPDGLALTLEYAADRFDPRRADDMVRQLVQLIEAGLRAPDAQAVRLPMLDEAALARCRAAGRGRMPSVEAGGFVAAFDKATASRPDAPALLLPAAWGDAEAGWGRVTFAELQARSSALASALGDMRGRTVAVCLPRSAPLVAALLGVMRAGGAYLPLDPDWPTARVAALRVSAAAAVLVGAPDGPFAALFPRVVAVPDRGAPPLPSRMDADAPAYVLFTSGSTGTPKGVVVTHGNLAHFCAALPLPRQGRALHFAPATFDASVMELWAPLLAGLGVLVAPPGPPPSLDALADLLRRGRLDFAWLTAGLFHALADAAPDALAAVGQLVAGGDALVPDRVARVLAAGGRVANGYGPTETTVLAAHHPVTADQVGPAALSVPLGRPLGGAEFRLLDQAGNPVPEGVPGELHVGGPGVATGYAGQPEQTRERFVPDPSGPGRLYRTGDLVRLRHDGLFEFVGRLDAQVKVRGFRVEPGEIEAALRRHPAVAEAAVTAPEEEPGAGRRLAAHICLRPGQDATADALRSHLAALLPAFMVPSRISFRDALPLTPSGKVDRAALDRLRAPASAPVAAEEDLGPAASALRQVWQELLRVPEIGADSHFLELGGDSILAMQVAARLARLGWRLSTRDALAHQTLRAQARAARPIRAAEGAASEGPIPPTPIQRWFLAMPLPSRVPWNQSVRLVLDDALTRSRVAAALAALEAAHEALRLRLAPDGAHLVLAPAGAPALDRLDLAAVAPGERADAEARALATAQAGLDLERGPIWRALWIEAPDRPPELLLCVHHLAVDGVSWRILLDDLAAALAGADLPAPPTGLGAWGRHLARAEFPPLLAERWAEQAGEPLPLLGHPGGGLEGDARTVEILLEPEVAAALATEAAPAWRATMTEVLLAGLAAGHAAAGFGDRLRLDLERHGRDHDGDLDLGRTVGWFTAITPLTVEAPWTAMPPPRRVLAVKEALRRQPEPACSYLQLRFAGPPPARDALAAAPAAEVAFNYLGRVAATQAAGPGFRLSDGRTGAERDPAAPRPYPVEVTAIAIEGLRLVWRFDGDGERGRAIQAWADTTGAALRELAAAARADRAGSLSPADLDAVAPAHRPDGAALEAALAAAELRPREVEAVLPVPPQQLGALLESMGRPGAGLQVEQAVFELDGPLDGPRLAGAWAAVLAARPALRAAFLWRGLPVPLLALARPEAAAPRWTEFDWSDLPEAAQADALDRFLAEDAARGFEADRPPLLRLALIRLAPGRVLHVLSFHHALLDGWSLPLVMRGVVAAYLGAAPEADEGPAPYAAWLAAQDEGDAEAFWRAALPGGPDEALLPTADEGPVAPGSEGAGFEEACAELSESETAALLAWAPAARVTPGSAVIAAWAAVLARAAGRDAAVVGVTLSGRPPDLAGAERQVGMFVNTLPLRVSLEGARGLWPLAADVHASSAGLHRFGHAPAGRVQRWAGLPPGTPPFESLVVFENYPGLGAQGEEASGAGLRVRQRVARGARTRIPLVLVALPGARLRLRLVADRARLPPGEAARWLDATVAALRAMTLDPAAMLAAVDGVLPDPPLRALPARARTTGRPPSGDRERAVAALWEATLGQPVPGADVSFFDLGGHSLLALDLARRWRDRFGTGLVLSRFLADPTVAGGARQLVGAPAGGPPLVPLREGGETCLFIAPGASGNPAAYRALAAAMRPDLRLVGYAPAALLDGDAASIPDLGEEMAEAAAAWQPSGAIHIAGHSLGAAIAWEAAAALARRGRGVGLLALLDQPAGAAPPAPADDAALLEAIVEAGARLAGKTAPALPRGLPDEAAHAEAAAALSDLGLLPSDAGAPAARALADRYRRAQAALGAWTPAPDPGAAAPLLVRGRGSAVEGPAADLGWAALCRGLRVAWVPGDHITMATGEGARDLARAVGEAVCESRS